MSARGCLKRAVSYLFQSAIPLNETAYFSLSNERTRWKKDLFSSKFYIHGSWTTLSSSITFAFSGTLN